MNKEHSYSTSELLSSSKNGRDIHEESLAQASGKKWGYFRWDESEPVCAGKTCTETATRPYELFNNIQKSWEKSVCLDLSARGK